MITLDAPPALTAAPFQVAPPKVYGPAITFKTDAPVDDSFKMTAPTSDKVLLGVLSGIDMLQTNIWLHTHVGGNVPQPYEENPLLGKHPSMSRMLVTGAVMDAVILHLPSPALRHLAISIEATNIAHNFSIGMHL